MNSQREKACAASLAIPPRLASPRPLPFQLILTILAVTIAGTFLFFFDPTRYGFYPYCTFYRATGLLCPGCGSLRALHHLLHGELAEALHFNILLVASLPFLGIYTGRMLLNRWRGHSSTLVPRPSWLWAALAILIVFGFLRNLPLAHAAWLAP